MHQQREDLDIIFRRTIPESVLRKIRSGDTLLMEKDSYVVSVESYTDDAYARYSRLNLMEYTSTEVSMRKEALDKSIDEMLGGRFSLLYQYADEVLHYDGNCLTCRLDKILNWNAIYRRLGQDIFTTAWLAMHNHMDNPDKMKNRRMTWPAVLKTDDARLKNILEKGLAENHFHLHGSTQNFALSWACLMNHPMNIHAYLNSNSNFRINMSHNASSGSDDNVMDWETRILYAAMVRALLFECCIEASGEDDRAEYLRSAFGKFDLLPLASDIKEHTEALRYLYGKQFRQPRGRMACLDYANCGRFYRVDEDDDNRLLAGERCFLYQCFRRQFRGEASGIESNLLYFYLLIKSNFRGELVQLNDRRGFQNFSDYQNRKNQLFEKNSEYWTESLRLSVCAGMTENHITSLEARIMPGMTAERMRCDIARMDALVDFSREKEIDCWSKEEHSLPEYQYYYVTHFAKTPFKIFEFKDRELALLPRNHKVRKRIKQQAKALERYMHICSKENQRVWGIDACSMEIGCRPETFSTEIRYLRECSREGIEQPWYWMAEDTHREIGVTYHVGEDFLDIADGLRAVDEAMQFLCMEKGDRIGHGLVLGIDPQEYYRDKRYSIYLRKQDYLDNLVWILYRSLELGVEIKEYARVRMTDIAMRLLCEVYEGVFENVSSGNPLDLYYHSWQLRGDHPDLYMSGSFQNETKLSEEQYDNYKIAGGLLRLKYEKKRDRLQTYRDNKDIAEMYSRYHFDNEVKKKGYDVEGVAVEKWYIEVVEAMQQAMRKLVFERGICIECNPTSNVLIGTFKSYNKHPVLMFNNFCLGDDDRHMNIQVSLNTDDLGVFDTSLENEYALMLNAVCRDRHEKGNYNDDAVYEYLEYLRTNGINMAFRTDMK